MNAIEPKSLKGSDLNVRRFEMSPEVRAIGRQYSNTKYAITCELEAYDQSSDQRSMLPPHHTD
jgi:hypothetical protein